jgi:hypothetical protein
MVDGKKEQQAFVGGTSVDTEELRRRLSWISQPLYLLVVALLWVLNPAVVDQDNLQSATLWGFLFGAGWGLIRFRREIFNILSIKMEAGAYRKNRVPEEFYWGVKEEVLFSKDRSEKTRGEKQG